MPEAVIVDAIRTPIGRAFKGSLKDVRADDLAAVPLKALVDRNPDVDFAQTADILMGNANGAGEQGYNIGRNAGLLSGIDHHVPACTLNRFCASSLQTIRMAFHAVKAGEGDQYIAAGVEAVSRAGGMDFEFHPQLDGSEGSAYNVYIPMGLTAENVAEKCNVSREAQDEWAVISQNRAVEARESGHFDSEIVAVQTAEGEVTSDDGPRPGTTLEKLAALQPAFKPDGTVTAGNACPLNDGAAAVIVMSDTRARSLGLTPLARIVSTAVTGLSPEIMGLGPVEATHLALQRASKTVADIDLFEINEAFAAQVIPSYQELDIPLDKLNVHGGAIALGHPFGSTGARITTTLINGLQSTDKTWGLETMCVGGGMGMAMVIERLS